MTATAVATGDTPEYSGPTAAQLRRFAQDNDLEVGARGLIPSHIRDRFAAAPKRVQKKYL